MAETKTDEEGPLFYKCPVCNGKGHESKYDILLGTYDDVVCWQCAGKCYLDWIEYARLGGFISERV